jgi:CHAT domain-containing protein
MVIRVLLLLCITHLSADVLSQDWNAFNSTGLDYYHQGKYEEASQTFQRALESARSSFGEVSNPYITSLSNLAFVHKASGNYAEAAQCFRLTLTLLEKLHPQPAIDQIEAHLNLGNLYLSSGQYDSCELYLQNSLNAIIQAHQSKTDDYYASLDRYYDGLVNVQNGFASLYRKRGKLSEAIALLEQQRELLKEFDPDLSRSDYTYKVLTNNLIGYHLESGNIERARILIKEYETSVGERPEDKLSLLYNLQNLGNYYRQLDLSDSAFQVWYSALEYINTGFYQNSELHLSLLSSIGELHCALEDYVPGIAILEQCKEIMEQRAGINPILYQTSLFNLAEAYHWSGAYAQADRIYQQLMNHLKNEVLTNFTYLSESEKIAFYRSQLDILNSYTFFALSISGVIPLQDQQTPYINKDITRELYDLQILTKGIILSPTQKMKKLILEGNDEQLKSSYQRWEVQKNQLATMLRSDTIDPRALHLLKEQIELQEETLSRSSASFKKGFLFESVSWRDIQQHLKPGEAAVEMVRFANGLLYGALILTSETNERPALVIIKSREKQYLEKEFYRQYINSIQYKMKDTTTYSVYWEPVYTAIRKLSKGRKVSRIYFSPDGIYHQLNVNTLYDRTTDLYVLDQVEIQPLTNTKEILKQKAIQKIPTDKKKAVLFGRPIYANTSLSDLPGTEKEVEAIATYLIKKNWEAEVFKQSRASIKNLKTLNSPTLLHLATHGFFTAGTAEASTSLVSILMNSGIALAADHEINGGSGILTAYEASTLNLDNTILTVLSACETGLGDYFPGEGVYGLKMAFTSAGTQHVLMSLWKVDDRATQELMSLFYHYWLKRPRSMKAAFRTAQIALRKSNPEPYYWGAFVLSGK